MRRREFILALGGAAAWSFAARGQKAGNVVRIGFLGASLDSQGMASQYSAFLGELREHGFNEGQNIIVDYRRNDDPRGIFAVAAELMRLQVDLVVATGPEVALQAVVGASRSIPIVFVAVQYDPVSRGYVNSLDHPGGNITGVFYRQPELAAKQLEILTQAFPQKSRLAVLYDTNSADQFSAADAGAKSMPLQLLPQKLEKPPYNFSVAFQTIAQEGAQMVLVLSSPFFVEHHQWIAAAAIEHRLPTMFVFKSYVIDGGLMSYGVEQLAMYRRIGVYVAKILKGTKPAHLPVEQPTKFELAINLKTARTLGVDIPATVLARADEVIE
jgi:putative tryptophan/tyrosine transport system substrate-binding protein